MASTEPSKPAPLDNGLIAYRVRDLPEGLDITEATSLLKQALAVTDLEVKSLTRSSIRDQGQVATISTTTPSAKLQGTKDQWEINTVGSGSTTRSIVIDTHFRDFTPLSTPKEEDHTVDCIALSGLGAHTFGSWKARGSSYMWLRDKLPVDLPNARVLIYGYDTQLNESDSFQTLNDIALSFRASLKSITDNISSRRSFIFIAHSFGGLVLKKALVRMPAADIKAVSDILLFGVPNQGMDVTSLYPMVHGQANLPLVAGLDKHNDDLCRLVKQFNRVFSSSSTNIVSFYETRESRTATRDSSGGWSMSGQPVVLVDRHSATNGLSSRKIIPINRTHSDMIKFGKWDQLYYTVFNQLSANASTAANVGSQEDFSQGSQGSRLQGSRLQGSGSRLAEPNDMAILPLRTNEFSAEDTFPESVCSTTLARPRSRRRPATAQFPNALRAVWAPDFNVEDSRFLSDEALFRAIRSGNQTAVRWLLVEARCNVNATAKNIGKETPLYLAVKHGDEALVSLLLEKGANVNATTSAPETALHLAVYERKLAIVRLLLDNGANINGKGVGGDNPLHIAVRGENEGIERLLLETRAAMNVAIGNSQTSSQMTMHEAKIAIVELLLAKGADINAKGRWEDTPFFIAVRKGNEAIMCLLLENGADINARSASKQTPFQRAMIEKGSGSVFQVLLKRGRNLQHNEPWEQTALHVAAEEGHERVVRLLLEQGANPDTCDSGDETPLDLARKFGFMPVVKVLEPVTHQESRGLFHSVTRLFRTIA